MSDLKKGDDLPKFQRRIDQADLVVYGAATWDWHPIHYDTNFTSSINLPGPVVDGQMFGAILAKQVIDFLGPNWFLSKQTIRFKGMVFAGEEITCRGAVAGVSDDELEFAQKVQVGDRLAVESTSSARLIR